MQNENFKIRTLQHFMTQLQKFNYLVNPCKPFVLYDFYINKLNGCKPTQFPVSI